MKVDAHQHFWKFDAVRDSWITDDMAVIQRDFLPEDLQPLLHKNGFDGCVTVQSDQSESENDFQLENAETYDFIRGVVGWVDLRSPDIEERLQYYNSFKKMKGFRHVLQGEAQRDLMLQPDFTRGIGLLNKYNFTYDLLIFPDQLLFAKELVVQFPDQPFVLDHIAKPLIKKGNMEPWKMAIHAAAQHQNLYCKLSGMVTEADWQGWTKDDIYPYLDVVLESFGPDRIMFGSDWPVCLVAASYDKVVALMTDYFSSFRQSEQEQFFGGNATRFYKLD